MILTVFERLILLNVLPERGDLTTIRIVRELREALSFTEAEHAELQFRRGDVDAGESADRVYWITRAERELDVNIGPKARSIIAGQLDALSKAGNLQLEHLPLCDKFEVGNANS